MGSNKLQTTPWYQTQGARVNAIYVQKFILIIIDLKFTSWKTSIMPGNKNSGRKKNPIHQDQTNPSSESAEDRVKKPRGR